MFSCQLKNWKQSEILQLMVSPQEQKTLLLSSVLNLADVIISFDRLHTGRSFWGECKAEGQTQTGGTSRSDTVCVSLCYCHFTCFSAVNLNCLLLSELTFTGFYFSQMHNMYWWMYLFIFLSGKLWNIVFNVAIIYIVPNHNNGHLKAQFLV